MKAAYLFVVGLFLVGVSCERHDWEETKVLHEQHGHGAHEGEGHGEEKAHGKDADSAEKGH